MRAMVDSLNSRQQHPKHRNINPDKSDHPRYSQIQRTLQKFIMRMPNIVDRHICGHNVQGIQNMHNMPECIHSHSRKRKILHGINRPGPNLNPPAQRVDRKRRRG